MVIAICDDDAKITDYLNQMIRKHLKNQCSIHELNSGDALDFFIEEERKGDLDILFLDIELGKDNGIALAQKVNRMYPHIKIIFITGYIDYSQYIFETQPTYFLAKPIRYELLTKALDKAMEQRSTSSSQILSVLSKGKVMSFYYRDILFFQSKKRLILIVTKDGQESFYGKLGDLEPKLPPQFVRCHQSYLVNLDVVKQLLPRELLLENEWRIPVSQSRYGNTKDRLIQFLGDRL